MVKHRSVATKVKRKPKAKEPPKEASVPPKPTPVPVTPTTAPAPKPKPVENPVAAKPVEVKPPEKPRVLVKVNGRLINFDGSAPLPERGLRALLLFPDTHRIFLCSRGQTRQFHSGEVLGTIPDDLEILTRE